jgi:polar amino acid transport system substrate-binding protein
MRAMVRSVCVTASLLALTVTMAACGGTSEGGGASSSAASTTANATASASAASCTKDTLHLHAPGVLTIATDNPAFQPWFGGDKGAGQGPWKADPNNGTGNPYTGQGYESAVAYAIAEKLGFSQGEVTWVAVPFNNSYKPGPKAFDFYVGQVSYSPQRAEAVDFSDGYFDVQQALVANKGTPITKAKTFADLKPYQLGVQIGTTSYSYIMDNIKPDKQPTVYNTSNDVITALNSKLIDGYLVDAPDAYVNVLIGEAKDGVVVGQFPTIGDQEHYGLVFEKGNPLVTCVNQAIAALSSDGTLTQLSDRYLSDITKFTVIQP